ncbi:MAG: hypothetical protein HYS86_04160 [Candidatus Chisholmbacteria bacterium]|nr:hypothetical protein [Candidatus Chisholmbacteria bacterium]
MTEYPHPTLKLLENHQALLAIPGVQQYIDQAPNPEAGLKKMAEELTSHLDARIERDFTIHVAGWSQKEADDFFGLPERKLFESQVTLATDPEARQRQLIHIGTYLYSRYRDAAQKEKAPEPSSPEAEKAQTAADALLKFIDAATYDIFLKDDFELSDRYFGIDPEGRKQGKVKPSPTILNLIDAVIKHTEPDEDKQAGLKQEVLAATEEGHFPPMVDILFGYNYPTRIRHVLERVWEKRARDPDLTREKVQLAAKSYHFLLSMGINLDTYLKLNGFPNTATTIAAVESFLEDTAPDFKAKLAAEAPESAANLNIHQPVTVWQMLTEIARRQNYPPERETTTDIEKKLKQIQAQLSQILPFSALETPYYETVAPTNVAASRRGWNMPIRLADEKNSLLIVNIIDPFAPPQLFLQIKGHEDTHKFHFYVVKRGEIAGAIDKNSWEKIDTRATEDIAQLVEDQLGQIEEPPTSAESPAETASSDLLGAFFKRLRGPWSLIQLQVRHQLEDLANQGKDLQHLSDQDATGIITQLDRRIPYWYSLGKLNFRAPAHWLFSRLNVLNPMDGTSYLYSEIAQAQAKNQPAAPATAETTLATTTEPKEPLTLEQAFTARFGKIWLPNPSARLVLYGVMITSATERNYDKIVASVSQADPQVIKAQLLSWGIAENLL